MTCSIIKDSRILGFEDSSEMLKNYKELKVWQKSYYLCLNIYSTTKEFPREEKYVLTSQIRRSALSILSNIAEGYGRKTTPEYIRSLYVSYRSICELETQVWLSGDLGYIKKEKLKNAQKDIEEVERMLKALIRSLEKKTSEPLNPRILESLNPFVLLKSNPNPPDIGFFHAAPFYYAGSRDIPDFRGVHIESQAGP